MLAIEVKDLVKTYKSQVKRSGLTGGIIDLFRPQYTEVRAVDQITLEVSEGECVGYIGPNGAGKSTSIKMLTGILQPTSGHISILGYNPSTQRKEFAKHIGVVFGQRTQLWWDIAVRESFELLRRIYDVPQRIYQERLDFLVSQFAVQEFLSVPVRKLSLGERMKCDIIASLIHGPQILFLDEPTIGLDAMAKNAIRRILRDLHQKSKTTIILTTHDLQEIEELCDRVVILDHGKILYDGRIEKLKSTVNLTKTVYVDFEVQENANCAEMLRAREGIHEVAILDARAKVVFDAKKITVVDILGYLQNTHRIKDISMQEPSIEEVITKMYTERSLDILL